jgi:uncharacterized protein
VIAWLAAQAWCTGKVGIIGKSWGGFNSLQVAARRPPELGAVITVYSTDDRYADDVHYMGGCLLAADMLSWASAMLAYNARPPDPANVPRLLTGAQTGARRQKDLQMRTLETVSKTVIRR